MSITFFIVPTEAVKEPTEKVYLHEEMGCSFEEYMDNYGLSEWEKNYLSYDENGYYENRGIWPSVNLSNDNAALILRALNLSDEPCGEIPANEIANVRRTILRRLNGDVSDFTRESHVQQGRKEIKLQDVVSGTERVIQEGQCTIYSMGIDQDGVKRRLMALDEVLKTAQELGLSVNWG